MEAEAAKAVPVQKVGGPVVIWKRDTGNRVSKQRKQKNIMVSIQVKLALKLDDCVTASPVRRYRIRSENCQGMSRWSGPSLRYHKIMKGSAPRKKKCSRK
jgi:hypothetical protein